VNILLVMIFLKHTKEKINKKITSIGARGPATLKWYIAVRGIAILKSWIGFTIIL
jgi:hypothetical protein